MGCRWSAAAIAVCVGVALSACSADSPDLTVVAGGGEDPQGTSAKTVRLYGYPSDMDVSGGTVHLLAYDEHAQKRLISIDPDGSVSTLPLDGDLNRYLAAGPDGEVYIAGSSAIYRVDGSELEPVVAPEDAGAPPNTPSATGSIEGVAVDDAGRLIWVETFLGAGPDGSEPALSRVMGLADGEVVRIAGSDTTTVSGRDLLDLQASPPSGMAAVDMPIRLAGSGGAIAVDEDGTIYLGGSASVLRIDPAGGIEAVLGQPSDGDPPREPFDDEGAASEFGGLWTGASMDASGSTLVVLNSALEDDTVDVGPFAWSGDFSAGERLVADKITYTPSGADGTFDFDDDDTTYGGLAVLVRDDRTSTAMAHVSVIALEDGVLYAVGQTRTRNSSHTADAEMLITKLVLPDSW